MYTVRLRSNGEERRRAHSGCGGTPATAVVAVFDGGDAPVVIRVGEEHQMTRRWMESSTVVGSGFGDDGVERR